MSHKNERSRGKTGRCLFFFFKQKTAYEMRISDWSSDVCSSDLIVQGRIADEANILPADSKAQLDAVLTAFDQRSGHPLVIVTTPSLGGLDIARFAATIADRRGMADSGKIGRAHV